VVAVVDVPGAHALEPGDLLGLHPVAGPLQMALIGARGGEHPLELHGGEHVGVVGIGVYVVLGWIKRQNPAPVSRCPPQLQVLGLFDHGQGPRPCRRLTHCRHSQHTPQLRQRSPSAAACSDVSPNSNSLKSFLRSSAGRSFIAPEAFFGDVSGWVPILLVPGQWELAVLGQVLALEQALHADGRLASGRNRANGDPGAGDRVAAGEHPFRLVAMVTHQLRWCPRGWLQAVTPQKPSSVRWPMAVMIMSPNMSTSSQVSSNSGAKRPRR
jgi:hypothetical protein